MYKNKKIFILGIARSGYEAAKLLSNYTKNILITDMKEKEEDKAHLEELRKLGLNVQITENQADLLDDSFDLIVKNPGVPLDVPILKKAEEFGILVVNEVEVAYNLLPKDVKIVAITGSNGKTTTTQVTYEILKAAGLPVLLGGNIGVPVAALVKDTKPGDILVLEISSHQLTNFVNFKTDISILTNLSETHLDFFGTYEVYKQNKKGIFKDHTKDNLAIINGGNPDSIELTKDISDRKIFFGTSKDDLYVKAAAIYYHDELIVKLKDIKLVGNHNYENIMCAIAVAKEFDVSNKIIQEVLGEFGGVEHRLEFVREVKGIRFYNDSKATNCVSTIIALDSFKEPITILLGGLNRQHSFEELKEHMNYVERVVCYGETKKRIKEFCDSFNKECLVVNTLTEAVNKAYELASPKSVVLLSPACASWDQYDSFEVRGDEFKKIVKSL